MRGVTSIVAGAVFLSLAVWFFLTDGLGMTPLLFAAGAAFLFFRGYQGQNLSEAVDPGLALDFVSNPKEAIVDAATDQLADWIGQDREKKTDDEQPSFDADAVFARYMEKHGKQLGGITAEAPAPAGFGRKGL
jgi:hypothetical protein